MIDRYIPLNRRFSTIPNLLSFGNIFVTFKNRVYEFLLNLFLRKFLYMDCTEYKFEVCVHLKTIP